MPKKLVSREIDSERVEKKIVQKSLQVKNWQMKMTSVNKVQFASLNDKQYHFLHRIVSLLFRHPLLPDLCELKNSYPKLHTVIEKGKDKLLILENQAVAKHESLRVSFTHNR